MVGLKLRVNLLRLTFCCSVCVLNEVLLGSQSTSLNVYLENYVLSRMYWVSWGVGARMSILICVLSFWLLMMPLEKKLTLTVLGRIIFICLCFCWCLCLSAYLYIPPILLQFVLSRSAYVRGSGLPFLSLS